MTHFIEKVPIAGPAITHAATAQDTPLIHDFNLALDALGEAFDKGDHTSIRGHAAQVVSILKQLLAAPESQNFKNAGLTTSWSTYLSPLRNLLTLLEYYLKPGLTQDQPQISRLQQALTPVISLIKGEVGCQQGLVARTVATAVDQGARGVKKQIQGFSGSTPSMEPEVATHPIIQISRLIGTYKAHGEDYLPLSRENHLSSALRHLDQKSNVFRGVEAYVYHSIEEGKLHENLDVMVQQISAFLLSEGEDRIFQFLYHKAVENNEVWFVSRTSSPEGQIAWGKRQVTGLASRCLSEQLKGYEKLWIAAAEHDEVKELEQLAKSMQKEITTPTELSHTLDKAIRFFQNRPDRLGDMTLQGLTQIAAGWLSLTYSWMGEHLESSELHALEDRLNHLQQQMNQGRYLEALVELKKELQKSPLAREMHESEEAVSPINTIQQSKEKLARALNPQQAFEKASWAKQMEEEKERLVDQVGYLSTFKTVFNVLGSSSLTKDPLTFQQVSDQAYARIMAQADDAPRSKQGAVFLHRLKTEIDNRDDISFFRKQFCKASAWIVMVGVRFFTQHFTHSFINYLTNTISLPTRQPLSTVHLSPVERINDCFIAQKKALSKWSADERGEEFGANGRKKAMEEALRDPQLNHGYEHNELVDLTTRCAIDQFLNIEGLSNKFFSWNRELENWTKRGSGIGYLGRLGLSLLPQILVTVGFYGSRLLEWSGSKVLKVLAKQFMVRFGITHMMLDSMKDSLYKQSQYTNAIDDVLLEQLLEVEKLLEKGGGEAIEHEGSEAKKLFGEAIANVVRVIDLNKNLTAEAMQNAQTPSDNALGYIADSAKDIADQQLRDAIVQLLIIVYQSVLTEDQMNELILKIFKKTNDSLFPHTVIQMYYSEEEKDAIARVLGHRPTDQELKQHFAEAHGKRASEVTDAEIQAQLKVRYNKTEQALRETTFRVIKKSVHQVVQDEGKKTFMSGSHAVVSYIDFMDRYLFENMTSRSTNIFRKSEEQLQAYERAESESKRRKILEALHKDSVDFLREYEKKQQLLDYKVNGKVQTAAHMRRMNEISNTAIMPQLISYQEALQAFIREPTTVSMHKLRLTLEAFYTNVYSHQAELEQIKQDEVHHQTHGETLSEKARIIGSKVTREGVAPVVLDQVERYANHRLNEIAKGAFDLYKDANVFESFLRHVVMLNFVESSGHRKRIKA